MAAGRHEAGGLGPLTPVVVAVAFRATDAPGQAAGLAVVRPFRVPTLAGRVRPVGPPTVTAPSPGARETA